MNFFDEKQLEQQKWVRKLQKEVRAGIKSIEQDQGVAITEARKRFGL